MRWASVSGRRNKAELRGWEAPYQEQGDGRGYEECLGRDLPP